MQAYIYCADIYCADCGKTIRKTIRKAGTAPPDPADESSYDSDEYPKGPYADGGGEADSPQHCGNHGDCFNAITLDGGHKIGAWLENPLTSDGVQYVANEIADATGDTEVLQLWAEWYAEELSYLPSPDADDDDESGDDA